MRFCICFSFWLDEMIVSLLKKSIHQAKTGKVSQAWIRSPGKTGHNVYGPNYPLNHRKLFQWRE
jgi:hypothetical protein